MSSTVNERDLIVVLKWLRDVRIRHLRRRRGPWAFRQALIMVLALDTAAALEGGVPRGDLDAFDEVARADAWEWVRRRG